MELTQAVGWSAVAALFFTMSAQAWKQWRDRVKHGVSKWFFAGQVLASTLFLAYSAMMGDRVFIVGNALVLAAAITGGAILWYNRARRDAAPAREDLAASEPATGPRVGNSRQAGGACADAPGSSP